MQLRRWGQLLICLVIFCAGFRALTADAVSAGEGTEGLGQLWVSDVSQEATGDVHLLKSDLKGNPISGVEYCIFREATLEEHRDPLVKKEWLEIHGEQKEVICVPFYLKSDLTDSPVLLTATEKDGKASFYGLPYGTYYIREEQTPQGYAPQMQPVEARINEQTTGATILIETNPTTESSFPVTTLITVAVVAVSGSAVILLLQNSKGKWP